MKRSVAAMTVVFVLLATTGCVSPSTRPATTVVDDFISLDEAKALIVSGKVKEIFQPHQGCVLLMLRDERILRFNQPHLDWVVDFVYDNGYRDKIDALSME